VTITLAQARRDYDIALFGGASFETVQQASAILVEAERAAETRAEKIKRQRTEASDYAFRAKPCFAEAAEYLGKAKLRELQGEYELAASFRSQAAACTRAGESLDRMAKALKDEVAELMIVSEIA
jgi:hypothetical protein